MTPLATSELVAPATAKRTLTPAQAARAIYIDFESRADQPPAVLGVLYAEGRRRIDEGRVVLRQDVVDPNLVEAAGAVDLGGDDDLHRYDTRCGRLRESLQAIVQRAVAQDRLIVSWSRHDWKVAVKYGDLDDDTVRVFSERFRDGKATARRWRRCRRPDVVFTRDTSGGTDKLARYFDLMGFHVPARYGSGLVARNIRWVEDALTKRGRFERLTARQQEAWKDVLVHNRYDCVGLRRVVTAAAEGLSASR